MEENLSLRHVVTAEESGVGRIGLRRLTFREKIDRMNRDGLTALSDLITTVKLEKSLRVLNEMQAEGVIQRYAIGGAVAAFLYIEPGTTFDLDIFVVRESQGILLTLEPIYRYLADHGYTELQKEALMIEGWPVQFLPPGTDLTREALDQAVAIEISGVQANVLTMEHLMAICLETGRPKDLARLVQFEQEGRPNRTKLMEILDRYGLRERWNTFRQRFFVSL